MCNFNTPILESVLPVEVLFNLMIDFEVLVLMVQRENYTKLYKRETIFWTTNIIFPSILVGQN